MIRHIAVLVLLLPLLPFFSSCYCEDCNGFEPPDSEPIDSTQLPIRRDMEWSVSYNAGDRGIAKDIDVGPDGGFFVTGTSVAAVKGDDIFIARFTDNGSRTWVHYIGDNGDQIGSAVVATPDGGCIVAAGEEIATGHSYHLRLLKIDRTGTIEWDSVHTTINRHRLATAIGRTPDGAFVVTGTVESLWGGDNLFLWKISDDGTVLWQKELNTGGSDEPDELTITDDGTIGLSVWVNLRRGSPLWHSFLIVDADGTLSHDRHDTVLNAYRKITSTGSDLLLADIDDDLLTVQRIDRSAARIWMLTEPLDVKEIVRLVPGNGGSATIVADDLLLYEVEGHGRLHGPYQPDVFTRDLRDAARTIDGGLIVLDVFDDRMRLIKLAGR